MTAGGKDIAIFGGSFNPPANHHVHIVRELSKEFDELVVVPCGPRPDKPSTNDIPSVYRAAMVDMAFQQIPRVRVDLFDLESQIFTRTVDLDKRYSREGTPWHVVGADLVAGGGEGKSQIQREWRDGTRLWTQAHFAVFTRPGYELKPQDLPPKHRLFPLRCEGASADIRDRLFRMQPVKNLLPEQVFQYVQRHNLYRGISLSPKITTRFPKAQVELIVDERNPEAVKLAKYFPKRSAANPDLFVVIGGDGMMLRSIRHHWRKRLPFYGINAGHTGFLLNQPRSTANSLTERDLVLHHLPLLWVETETVNGDIRTDLAFNDAWVERATGQSAWISVSVNGKLRIDRLISDGVLVATASGSAAYGRAMGAAPIPFNTPVLLLVGSNVLRPYDWKFAVLPIDSTVEFVSLDPVKRPLVGFSDGEPLGEVKSMRIRLSRSAAVELAFDPEFDPAEKLAHLQFPEL
jgi:nicotinate (nicotinamide) nucleotide adenylyltransferase